MQTTPGHTYRTVQEDHVLPVALRCDEESVLRRGDLHLDPRPVPAHLQPLDRRPRVRREPEEAAAGQVEAAQEAAEAMQLQLESRVGSIKSQPQSHDS